MDMLCRLITAWLVLCVIYTITIVLGSRYIQRQAWREIFILDKDPLQNFYKWVIGFYLMPIIYNYLIFKKIQKS
jgi:hypothetical protein